jgi:hypothetical protein
MRDVAIRARSRPARIAGWTLAAIVALAAAAAYSRALWRAPGWTHATTAQDRYNARVLVISVGGAIVIGTGLLYTARNYRLSRRGQITDQFTIALETARLQRAVCPDRRRARPRARHARLRRSPRRRDRGAHRIHPRPHPPPCPAG